MHIAITGGSGRLGCAVTEIAVAQGHSVVSIDRSLPTHVPPGGEHGVTYLVADVCNFGELVGAMHGCDALIHLAAHISSGNYANHVVYADNTIGSYNALSAAAILGINRVVLASSINAIGGVYSRAPQYDYFPVDEQHSTYAEDPYSLSKWVLEQQGDAFARRYAHMQIASLRFHGIVARRAVLAEDTTRPPEFSARHLWGYTQVREASRACLLGLTADFDGHEVFYIVAPQTTAATPSQALARQFYPETPLRGDLAGHTGFFDCTKAARLLGWYHEDGEPEDATQL